MVAVSLDCGGGGLSGSSLGSCLWAKISTGLWMVKKQINQKFYLSAAKVVEKNEKEGEFSPVVAIAASLDCGGGHGWWRLRILSGH